MAREGEQARRLHRRIASRLLRPWRVSAYPGFVGAGLPHMNRSMLSDPGPARKTSIATPRRMTLGWNGRWAERTPVTAIVNVSSMTAPASAPTRPATPRTRDAPTMISAYGTPWRYIRPAACGIQVGTDLAY